MMVRVYTDEEIAALTNKSAVRAAFFAYVKNPTDANGAALVEASCQAEIMDILYRGNCRDIGSLLNS